MRRQSLRKIYFVSRSENPELSQILADYGKVQKENEDLKKSLESSEQQHAEQINNFRRSLEALRERYAEQANKAKQLAEENAANKVIIVNLKRKVPTAGTPAANNNNNRNILGPNVVRNNREVLRAANPNPIRNRRYDHIQSKVAAVWKNWTPPFDRSNGFGY